MHWVFDVTMHEAFLSSADLDGLSTKSGKEQVSCLYIVNILHTKQTSSAANSF